MYKMDMFKDKSWGFPGGAVVESLPADAGGAGLWPGPGKIPHATERLGPWAMAAEPARPEPVLHTGEATTVRGPHTTKKEKKKEKEWVKSDTLRFLQKMQERE